MRETRRFEFGRNWQAFVRTAMDDARVANAVDSLRRALKIEELSGKSFLDIGCGSGLFSLAACLLGAERVVALDFDPNAIDASRALRTRSGVPAERWEIMRGSVLDVDAMAALGPADVVYSWGVLHHTGNMWRALDNASESVRPNGLFCIAIYNEVEGRLRGSRYWARVKRTYVGCPRPVQAAMEVGYFAYRVARMTAGLKNPVRVIREYGQDRGMSFWRDLIDWLGGYPYEYASAGAVVEHVLALGGFCLIGLRTTSSLGCNEFTFRRETGGSRCPSLAE